MVGLSVGVGGFISHAEEQEGGSSGNRYEELEARVVEAGARYGMTRAKPRGGGILLVGESLDAAMETANTFTQGYVEEPGYLPFHVTVEPGGTVEMEDGESVQIDPAVRLTAHHQERRPVKRV